MSLQCWIALLLRWYSWEDSTWCLIEWGFSIPAGGTLTTLSPHKLPVGSFPRLGGVSTIYPQIYQPKMLKWTLFKSLELSLLLHILAALAFPNPLFLSPQVIEIATWCLDSSWLIHWPGSKLGQTQCSLSFSTPRVHSPYTPCCPLFCLFPSHSQ